MSYRAAHLPGGNRFDDVRLDLPASFRAQDEWLQTVEKSSVGLGRLRAAARRGWYRAEPYRLREAVVNDGLRRRWFEEFRDYWENVVEGRPLTLVDFHNLRFSYRVGAQYRDDDRLEWGSQDDHLANWQLPRQLFQTFEFVYRSALHPSWGGRVLFDLLEPGMRVLEYGCGVAPTYRTWRTFLAHRTTQWLLADIPGHAFHYARHVYGRDAPASFAVIDDFENPLGRDQEQFDLIVIQTVFEHLDRPRFVAEYLLDRLKPGGLIWFDYIVTGGTGLDSPAALAGRRETLEYLATQLDVVRGDLRIDDRSLGATVARKR